MPDLEPGQWDGCLLVGLILVAIAVAIVLARSFT
jgi:hypothetical protein